GFPAATLDASEPAATTVTLPRPAIRAGRRLRRQEKGGLVFFLSVVAGGLLAAPLAILTLWWVFHVDRLDLGPRVARYAPWIVPVEFRGEPPTDLTPARPFTNRPTRPAEKTVRTPRLESPAALQTLPGLDEPAKQPTEALKPTIDAPLFTESEAASPPKSAPQKSLPKKTAPLKEPVSKPPPMPDLKDLLPD